MSAITIDNVRSRAQVMSASIMSDQNLLHEIGLRHKEAIQKRWRKRNHDQRRRVLLRAWPNMAVHHRPDIAEHRNQWHVPGPSEDLTPSSREKYFWPQINQEDLIKKDPLLVFLNARAHHKPHRFAYSDFDRTHFGRSIGVIGGDSVKGYLISFEGGDPQSTYGDVIEFHDRPVKGKRLNGPNEFDTFSGLLILEIQQKIYKFLVAFCQILLHDLQTTGDLVSAKLPIKPETSFRFEDVEDTVSSAPYYLSSSIDLDRLADYASAKLQEAEDHVWALRENPGYFDETIHLYSEHRPERIRDASGQEREMVRPKPTLEFWQRVLTLTVSEAYAEVELWSFIQLQLIKLQGLSKTQSMPRTAKDLSREQSEAFQILYCALLAGSQVLFSALHGSFYASPAVRTYSIRNLVDVVDGEEQEVFFIPKSKIQGKIRKELGDLFWLFHFSIDQRNVETLGLDAFVDQLVRTLENNPKQKELVSSHTLKKLSDLSLVTQCMNDILQFYPSIQNEVGNRSGEILEKFRLRNTNLFHIINIDLELETAKLGVPNGKRFYYPAEKARNEATTSAMRSAEKHLDDFWREMDRVLASKYGSSQRLRELLSDESMQRSPDWVTSTDTENKGKGRAMARAMSDFPEIGTLLRPFSELRFDTEGAAGYIHTPEKTKIKTRGFAKQPSPEVEVEDQEPADDEPKQRIYVDKRAMKVFSTIFHTPSATSLPGEVSWDDFEHAMTSAGFTTEKLKGSAWRFTPTTTDQAAIQFHEPHPSTKIPFVIARGHGSRLNRRYGWHAGTFELKRRG